jgi:hypothetical protein
MTMNPEGSHRHDETGGGPPAGSFAMWHSRIPAGSPRRLSATPTSAYGERVVPLCVFFPIAARNSPWRDGATRRVGRTGDEGRRVLAIMADHGLRQGEDGLQVYVMCEIPSNVVLAEEFLAIFDGFSIGSNDLTQLTLGLDRDSETVARLFDERDGAVRWMIGRAIDAARRVGKPIGICGQAPSDYPDFAAWLVERGIDSIALNPDVAIRTALVVAEAERRTAPVADGVAG